MTTVLGVSRTGLITPIRSTARSDSAARIDSLVEQARMHLLKSFAVRRAVERALEGLEEARDEASYAGWDGYGAKPMDVSAYINAKLFLESLPTTAPSPEVS